MPGSRGPAPPQQLNTTVKGRHVGSAGCLLPSVHPACPFPLRAVPLLRPSVCRPADALPAPVPRALCCRPLLPAAAAALPRSCAACHAHMWAATVCLGSPTQYVSSVCCPVGGCRHPTPVQLTAAHMPAVQLVGTGAPCCRPAILRCQLALPVSAHWPHTNTARAQQHTRRVVSVRVPTPFPSALHTRGSKTAAWLASACTARPAPASPPLQGRRSVGWQRGCS